MTNHKKRLRLRASQSMPLIHSSNVVMIGNHNRNDSDDEEQASSSSSSNASTSSATRSSCNSSLETPSFPSLMKSWKQQQHQHDLYPIRSNREPHKIAKRTVLVAISIFASFWICFYVIMMYQFHHSQQQQHHVDPIAFWEHRSESSSSRITFRALPVPTHVTTIPLPLPPNKISVSLINYSRPRMIRDSTLMRTLLEHPNVDEVLLLHANPKTAFEFVHPKVVNIDATRQNDEMGLSLRFYFCQLARNEWVLHVDDDMEFPSSTLNELLIEYSRNPKRIVGPFGRSLVLGNSFNGYSSLASHKTTEVILTKLMLMERNICANFFEYAHLVWDDVILSSGEGPLWNGEDIFMSLVANHVYGGTTSVNYAMDWLDVWQASDTLKDYDHGKLDISGGMKGYKLWDWQWWQSVLRRNRHYSFRGTLWQLAKRRLAELGDRPILST